MKLEIKKDVLKILTETETDLIAGGSQNNCTSTAQACGTNNSPHGTSWLPCSNGCGSNDPVYCSASGCS